MNVTALDIPEVLLIGPRVFGDERGFFFESYHQRAFEKAGIPAMFVQDNRSQSAMNVLRGLHYQTRQVQGMLVRVIAGEVFDVAVDIREISPTFGRQVAATLSAENRNMLWIPPGFAHGFLVTRGPAEFVYKVTDYWDATSEHTILWNDPDLDIAWPTTGGPIPSTKDAQGVRFRDAEYL